MNLSNNRIESLDEISRFRNLVELNLDSNNISEIKNPESFSYIDNIIVVNNPIANNTELPKNFTQTEIANCDRCGTIISNEYVNDNGKSLCKSCIAEYKKELMERIPPSKEFQDALNGPPQRGCMLALLVIISLSISMIFV